ncbi:amidohydrolase [Flavobacteriaceae bacterium]|nr:amidohydrolase [Flavobacteriaceae bacterium]MDA9037729.1 amidohydrolase [Flavobacteriaceae bacterium]MDC0386042.1 amidohydrolase [Flavobacteriaceae bacterium]
MKKILNGLWTLIRLSFALLFIGGLTYYVIDKIQEKKNLMDIEEYSPKSTLVVPQNQVKRAKYPFIDVHNHQFDMPLKDLSQLVTEMDSLNMAFMINLSGFRGLYLQQSLKNVKKHAPTRFGLFVNIDFEKIDDPDFASEQVAIIEQAVQDGVMGLKVYKSLGLTDRAKNGDRIAINDPRLDPIWKACGDNHIPVLIHSGEPESFWNPKDRYNERWLELRQKPNRYRDPKTNPSFEEVLSEQHAVFAKHPNTTFINAHLGWMGNNLDRLGTHLDRYPNVMTEIGAVLAELGRQPKRARQFFVDYQDRILFGKDAYKVSEYYTYFRVLETDDEYFDYYRKRHAHWKMYGLALPDSILKKIYFKNALRLFPTIDSKLFKPAL